MRACRRSSSRRGCVSHMQPLSRTRPSLTRPSLYPPPVHPSPRAGLPRCQHRRGAAVGLVAGRVARALPRPHADAHARPSLRDGPAAALRGAAQARAPLEARRRRRRRRHARRAECRRRRARWRDGGRDRGAGDDPDGRRADAPRAQAARRARDVVVVCAHGRPHLPHVGRRRLLGGCRAADGLHVPWRRRLPGHVQLLLPHPLQAPVSQLRAARARSPGAAATVLIRTPCGGRVCGKPAPRRASRDGRLRLCGCGCGMDGASNGRGW
mmetsp:Transcript_6917/g.18169  ORF Transcript_6917/g.18169 Transcript_6917/m.18169 type:complete len:268 (-) Transcript_6917:263-1066(-)